MKTVALIFGLLLASSASALDLSCSRSLAHLTWETPVRIAKGRAFFPEGSVKMVHVRKALIAKDHDYTELRVEGNGMQWSMLCLNAAQKLKLQQQCVHLLGNHLYEPHGIFYEAVDSRMKSQPLGRLLFGIVFAAALSIPAGLALGETIAQP